MFADYLKKKIGAGVANLKVSTVSLLPAVGGLFGLASAGAGNYTPQYSSTDFSTAAPGFQDSFSFLLDCLTGMGNWFVTNAMGQLYIGMACLMFVFILIKSLFRHSGGRRR